MHKCNNMKNEYKTLAIGTIFTYNGKTYQVVQNNSCTACAFASIGCTYLRSIIGNCTKNDRQDSISAVFKEVNDMKIENNQLTIDIPEGMEIDTENSNLVNGIIKFKTKNVTYNDVYNEIHDTNITINTYFGNEVKLKALVKLMNIAKYYNNDWQPNWSNSKENKYCIKFDYYKDRFYVDYNNSIGAGDVFFKNSEDARAVINNPNFKSILNTIYKD